MRTVRVTGRLIAGVAVAALFLSACGRPSGSTAAPTGAATTTKLTAAYSEIVFTNLPEWVAKEAGIFEKNHLDVDLQQINSANAIAALLAGQVQVAHAGGSETMSANVGGADLIIVGVTGGVYPYYLMAQSSITSPEELRGKKIGISQPGSSSDIATRVVLRRFNLDPDVDVTLVPVGSLANRTAALLGGAIDAGLDNPPGSLAQEAQGLHPLLDLASLKLPAANNAVAVQRSFADSNKAVVQAYMDSLTEAVARIKKDKPYAVQVLKQYYKSDDDVAMSATYDFLLEAMAETLVPKSDQFTDAVDTLTAKNESVRGFDLSKLLVTTYAQNSIDRKVGAS